MKKRIMQYLKLVSLKYVFIVLIAIMILSCVYNFLLTGNFEIFFAFKFTLGFIIGTLAIDFIDFIEKSSNE